ncbi:MAG: hypothetical protein AAFR25_00250, partial [Cyanobacteria bacterium J06629_19]
MDTQLTYEIVGGALGGIAIVIGVIGATRQKSLKTKKAESAQSQLTRQIEQLTLENKTFTEALVLAKSAVNDLEQQLTEAKKKFKGEEKQRQHLDKSIATVRSEAAKTETQLETLRTQLETAEAQLKTSKAQLETAETQLKATESQQQTKEQAYSQQTKALQDELATEKASKADLVAAEPSRLAELTSLRQHIEALESATKEKEMRLENLRSQLQAVQKAQEKSVVQQNESQTLIETLRQQINELSAQNESIQQANESQVAERLSEVQTALMSAIAAKEEAVKALEVRSQAQTAAES